MIGLKFKQHIDVAVRSKILPEDGTKERKFTHMVAPTELGELLAVDPDPVPIHRLALSVIIFMEHKTDFTGRHIRILPKSRLKL